MLATDGEFLTSSYVSPLQMASPIPGGPEAQCLEGDFPNEKENPLRVSGQGFPIQNVTL